MGFNKLLAPLSGQPVLAWSIAAFQNCDLVDEIILVGGADAEAVSQNLGAAKVRQVIPGGAERHWSVWAGLQAVSASTTHVAVHDGGRPLISPAQISRCIEAARIRHAVTSARRITETMKRCDAEGRIVAALEREHAWIMETPQVFERGLLHRAYQQVLADGLLVTDEVSAVQHLGEPVWVVENHQPNLKITYPADLVTAAKLLTQE
jgi:2-C-methyl-D-erythritol 4-phosphate cytidylyltransferase